MCQDSLSAFTGSDAVEDDLVVLGDTLEDDPDDAGVNEDNQAHLCKKTQNSKLELDGDSLLISLKSLDLEWEQARCNLILD